jgi:hypothetical protein
MELPHMHEDHVIFIQATHERKRIKVTHSTEGNSFIFIKVYIPLDYTSSSSEVKSNCYYFWDPNGKVGERCVTLLASQITRMELTDEVFDPTQYIVPMQ